MTLPVIGALRHEFDKVTVLANRRCRELGAETMFALDDRDLARFFALHSEAPERWRHFFSEQDLVISYLYDPEGIFERNVCACGIADFIAGPHRVDPAGPHATEQLARPLLRLGISVTDFAAKIELSDSERAIARAQFKAPIVAMHPGSGSIRKNWPVENWIALAQELLARGERIVVIGGEADEKEVARFRQRFANRVDYIIDWPLRRLAALLASTRFIGHDSGISHLAAAAGARCLILFGPTDARIWRPRNENARSLIAPGGDLNQLELADVLGALEVENIACGDSLLSKQGRNESRV